MPPSVLSRSCSSRCWASGCGGQWPDRCCILYFLVPFGEFLTPGLQDITTFFIRHGLEMLGVPAYIDGYVIEIPQGTFFVAEACAGLRFLIASIAFGCLYALLMYRSPLRRGVFILVSILVPIIANGFRAIGIVYLGHILGSAEAAAADHLIYGWIFFSLVILLLIALGLPFREDEVSTGSTSRFVEAPAVSLRGVFPVAVGIAIVAAVGPVVGAGLTMAAATSVVTPSRIDVGPDCEVQPVASAEGATVRSQRVLCGAVSLDMSWEAFSPRSTAAPLMSARRKMVAGARTEGIQENWLDQSDGTFNAWRVMKSTDPAYVIATSVWIDGRPVRPGLGMRVRMALNSLIGSDYAPMVVTVTPTANWETRNVIELRAAESSVSRFLQAHPDLDRDRRCRHRVAISARQVRPWLRPGPTKGRRPLEPLIRFGVREGLHRPRNHLVGPPSPQTSINGSQRLRLCWGPGQSPALAWRATCTWHPCASTIARSAHSSHSR